MQVDLPSSSVPNSSAVQTRSTVLLSPSYPIMKPSYIQNLLLCFLPALTSARQSESSTDGSPCGTCIQDNEVEGIAQRWLDAFATGGLPTLDSAVTENVSRVISLYMLISR